MILNPFWEWQPVQFFKELFRRCHEICFQNHPRDKISGLSLCLQWIDRYVYEKANKAMHLLYKRINI